MSDFKYHRVSSRFWTDEKALRWDDDTRLLALYLLTCPHRTTEGLFRLPKPYIAADLGWSMERLEKPFAKLLADGFIQYDETVCVMLLPNALKYNPPENTNQAIRAARAVAELPETPLLREFQRLAEQYSERLAKQLAELLGNPQTQTQTQAQAQTQQTDDDPGEELDPSPADAGQLVGQPVCGGDDSQDSLEPVYEHYRQRIGILGPLTVDKLRWWHEEQHMEPAVLIEAIERTAAAREARRINGSIDNYLFGVIRHMYNEGLRTAADLQARARADPHSPDYDPVAVILARADEWERQYKGVAGGDS